MSEFHQQKSIDWDNPVSTVADRIHERTKTARISIPGGSVKPKNKPIKNSKDKLKAIETLTKRIETAQNKADNISTEVSGNYTHKRGREAEQRRSNKKYLEKNIQALIRMKNEWENDTIPEVLKKIRSTGDIETLFNWGYPQPLDGTEYDHFIERHEKQMKSLKRLGIENKEDANEAKELLKEYREIKISEEQQKAEKFRIAIENLRGQKIQGFFPTPKHLIDKMMDYANIFQRRGMKVLEPSAGIGHIADEVKACNYDHEIHAVEIRPALCNILELKGYETIACDDILNSHRFIEDQKYDRIIMNPPFEKNQDIIHIKHCFDNLLADNGILVSVASIGVMHNSNRNIFTEFQEFVLENGCFDANDEGSFKGVGTFNSTGVGTCLVILNK
jgi:hypothetical protein